MTQNIVVMGAGLTGCAVALELALRGFDVSLVDRFSLPMLGASLRNEGKIHLGFTYAADSSFATAEYQLRGALTFSTLLKRWTGKSDMSEMNVSNPFLYLVDNDSLVSPKLIEAHYEKVERRYQSLIEKYTKLCYLDSKPSSLWDYASREMLSQWFSINHHVGYHTNEVAIDPAKLSALLQNSVIKNERINFQGEMNIKSVKKTKNGFNLSGNTGESVWNIDCNTLVNCTWDSRLYFDQLLGIDCPDGLLHRLKYRVITDCPISMVSAPSVTKVLGRYGDVVVRPDSTMYLSWYPAGLLGWSNSLLPPKEWLGPMQGKLPKERANEIANNMREGISNWYPRVEECKTIQVDAGIIVAWGENDIDEPRSGLHRRAFIGSWGRDGYWTVEPGKLTTAPLVGFECAEKIAWANNGEEYAETTFSDSLLDRLQRGSFH